MGDYLTRQGLIESVGLATVEALAGDQSVADNQALVEQAIADAEAEANGYLAGRYETPLSPAPPWLRLHVGRLALWRLLSAKGYTPGSPDESIRKDRDAAIKFLEAVRDGKVHLGQTGDDGTSQPRARVVADHPKPALPPGWEDCY